MIATRRLVAGMLLSAPAFSVLWLLSVTRRISAGGNFIYDTFNLITHTSPDATRITSETKRISTTPEILVQGLPLNRTSSNAECDLCADNWFFILGAEGRTGSTTIMFTFLEVPGIQIAGEHDGLLNEVRVLLDRIRKLDSRRENSAWYRPPLDEAAFACMVQQFTKNLIFGVKRRELEPNTKIMGFKEIRYMTYSPDMFLFLMSVFPCARFAFSVRLREHVPVRQEFGDNARKRWIYGRSLVNLTHAAFPDRSVIFPVENLGKDPMNKALHQLLGVRGCDFRHLNDRNLDRSYSEELDTEKRHNLLDGICDFSGVDFRLSPQEMEAQQRTLKVLSAQMAKVPPWESIKISKSQSQRKN